MSVQSPQTTIPETTPEETVEYAQQSALKPLLYILVLPFAVIALLQWSGLPAMLVNAVTGH